MTKLEELRKKLQNVRAVKADIARECSEAADRLTACMLRLDVCKDDADDLEGQILNEVMGEVAAVVPSDDAFLSLLTALGKYDPA